MTRTLTRSLRSATLGAFAAGIFGATLVFVIFGDLAQKPFFYGWLLASAHAYGVALIHRRAVGAPMDAFFRAVFLGGAIRAALFVALFVVIHRDIGDGQRNAFALAAWSGYFAATGMELIQLRRRHGQ